MAKVEKLFNVMYISLDTYHETIREDTSEKNRIDVEEIPVIEI